MKLDALRKRLRKPRRKKLVPETWQCSCQPLFIAGATNFSEAKACGGPHHRPDCIKHWPDYQCTCDDWWLKGGRPAGAHQPECFKRRIDEASMAPGDDLDLNDPGPSW